MAVESLRAHPMRSGLTILGVVIGVTTIVGMTALIRGFDRSLQEMIRQLGPKTIFMAKFSGVSFMSGQQFLDLVRRPNLTVDDAKAIGRLDTVQWVDVWLGGNVVPRRERIHYRGERTKRLAIVGASETFAQVNFVPIAMGRFFTGGEVAHRRRVVVLGRTPYQSLFPFLDPIGKTVRIGTEPYTVVGVLAERPSPGGFDLGQNDFAVIPYTRFQAQFGVRAVNIHGGRHRDVTIVIVPKDRVSRDEALRDVEALMRTRHGLRLDEPNDFDLVTQEAAMKVWSQLTQATFLGLVAISSIALLVGGIGVMAITTISVTERTREIGLRKALGARRREILAQFLVEAILLTSAGGLVGVALGSTIGLAVHLGTGFPVSLPWWSFALGLGVSTSVGLGFGIAPAVRASRLDPIEALRYE